MASELYYNSWGVAAHTHRIIARFWALDVYGLSTPTAIIHSCPYLTEDNRVKWGRDHETITITLGDNHTRSIKAKDLLHSWGDIIGAIPKWCLDLIKNPSLRPDEFSPPPGARHAFSPLNAFTTPNNKWFVALGRGFFPAERKKNL
eukprot:scaffold7523_cov132-Isochrysis_galbana.AAC.9